MGSYMIRFRSSGDVKEYKDAGKKAKHGISMVMDAIEQDDMKLAKEGAKKAYEGIKTMCDISQEMESQYGERGDGMNERGMNSRDWRDWNERDDDMLERRMRDSKGRYM